MKLVDNFYFNLEKDANFQAEKLSVRVPRCYINRIIDLGRTSTSTPRFSLRQNKRLYCLVLISSENDYTDFLDCSGFLSFYIIGSFMTVFDICERLNRLYMCLRLISRTDFQHHFQSPSPHPSILLVLPLFFSFILYTTF